MHHDTPKRCRIKGVIEYLNAHYIPYFKRDVFQFFDASHTQAYDILNGNDRTCHNDSTRPNETRERKRKITSAQIAHADQLIENTTLDMKEKSLS